MVLRTLPPLFAPFALLIAPAAGVAADRCATELIEIPVSVSALLHDGCAVRAKDGKLERDYAFQLDDTTTIRVGLSMPGGEPELRIARDDGVTVASAEPDADGASLILALEAGNYRIDVAGLEGSFTLEAMTVIGKGQDLTVELDAAPVDIRGNNIFMDLAASVRNETADTLRVDVDFVLSRDSIAGGNDLEVVLRSEPVAQLLPNQRLPFRLEVFAENAPRNYFFYVRATPTLNDVRGAPVNSLVRQLTLFADLLVATPVLATTEFFAGDSLLADATVRNVGVISTGPQLLRFHLSSSSVIKPTDTRLGSPITINPLSQIPIDGITRASQTASLTIPLDVAPGTYWVGACVNPDPKEISSANNCSGAVPITVIAGGVPDLTVENPSVSPAVGDVGGTTNLRVSVRNAGDGRAPASTLRFYRSVNATISPTDTPVGSQPIATLAAGQASSVVTVVSLPQQPGEYWLGACIESSGAESNTANDCSRGERVTVLAVNASAQRSLTPVLAVDPGLSCPGFYIGKALAIGSQGRWGMSIQLDPTQRPLLQGGINMGGGFGNAQQPGYAAFTIANRAGEVQVVDVGLEVRKPGAQSYRIEIVRRSPAPRAVVASRTFTANSATLRAELEPGFYTVRVFSTATDAAAASFNMTLATRFADRSGGAFQGGVNVGGVMGAGTEFGSAEGFAAFCIDREQPVRFETFGNDSFGASGVRNVLLQVLDRDRNVVDQDPRP